MISHTLIVYLEKIQIQEPFTFDNTFFNISKL